jgi:DNA-binding NtrC family response regulator
VSMAKAKYILIVDDDPKVLFILRAALEQLKPDFQIETANGGARAMEKVEARPFDLVITDLMMPGVGGIELTKAIRAQTASTVVIWITAYACHKLREERQRLQVFRCLDKPLRIDKLRRVALEALANGQGAALTEQNGGENLGVEE